jgi:hypothetical protein
VSFINRIFGGGPTTPLSGGVNISRPTAITRTLQEGRALFPVSDYGYSSFFDHPNATISDPLGMGELRISSETPRRSENGRYYPGFDCIESAYWLGERLRKEGFDPQFVRVETPIFQEDYGVSVNGQLLSLTPGVMENDSTVKIGGPIAGLDVRWLQKARINNAISGRTIALSCAVKSPALFVDLFGIYFPAPGIMDLAFGSLAAHNGLPINGMFAPLRATSHTLTDIKKAIEDDNEKSALSIFEELPARLQNPDKNNIGRVLADRSVRTGREMMPKIIRLLDPEWVEDFSSGE